MSQQHASIPVPGAACAGYSVERVLSRLTGVIFAYVNGATEVAEVDYDDERVSVETLREHRRLWLPRRTAPDSKHTVDVRRPGTTTIQRTMCAFMEDTCGALY